MRLRSRVRFLALAVVGSVVVSCGDDGTSFEGLNELVFASPPPDAVAGVLPSIQVRVVDDNGAILTASSAPITIVITPGTGATGAVLTGTSTRNAVGGVATFDSLVIAKAGGSYTLTATSTHMVSGTSAAFDVAPNVPDHMVVTSPSTSTAGQSLTPAFAVRVEDAFGNAATNTTASVTASLTGGAAGAQLSGTTTRMTVGGVATFDDLGIDRSGTGYSLMATTAGIQSATSTPFDVRVSVRFVIGAAPTGLEGFEASSSLVIEAQDPMGTFLQSVPITWTASAGTLTSMSPVTNSIGRAQARWRLGPGTQTLTASIPGGTATTTAVGLPEAVCTFNSPNGNHAFPPRDTLRFQPTTRTVRVAALFIDFPDLVPTRTIPQMLTDIVNPAVQMLASTSDGKVAIELVPTSSWMRMPESAAVLNWTIGGMTHLAYIDSVIARHDPTFDFSNIDHVWIFRSRFDDPQQYSGTATFFKGANVIPSRDGREMKSFVTFGSDAHYINFLIHSPRYGSHVVAHEMGHVYGLPDLYAYQSAPGQDGSRFTGGWSWMGAAGPGTSWTAAERYYVGALPEPDVLCPPSQPFSANVTLRPIEETTGLRGIGLRSTATRMTWLESRHSLGLDANFCSTGLLVYDVNGSEAYGNGPVRVREIHPSPPGPETDRCHVLWNAPAQVGDTIQLGDPPVRVRVLSRAADGSTTVSLTRQ